MSLRRKLSVLVGLALAGLLFGAFAGTAVVSSFALVAAIRTRDLATLAAPYAYLLGAMVGGSLGVVLAPLASFGLWRHVPLGRLFGYLTLGTILGGVPFALLGWPMVTLVAGAAGFLYAGDRAAWPRTSSATSATRTPPRSSAG
jgi:hypothetical protein